MQKLDDTIKEMIAQAHKYGVPVLIDGAQAAPHMPVDVQELDCDFYAFSGHKMFGPTGAGVLYGRAELLERMPPYQGGGDMISLVTFEKTHYNVLPYKFEAGTPNIAGVIGLGAAVDYLNELEWPGVMAHENELMRYATEALQEIGDRERPANGRQVPRVRRRRRGPLQAPRQRLAART